ncbi:MAG: ogt1 [Frankiales bacterium]|jgi:methylated-DNA-[protein]-cysteine S-methyltransferase|nr:ogt1 [Frankiales bacterium]
MRAHTVVDSPVGRLTLVAEDGVLAGLFMDGQRHLPAAATFGARADGVLPEVRAQLTAYFARELTEFHLPMAAGGTPFQASVWAALREVPYGATCTYAELAAAVGRPTAVRAVGAANGRNPVCLVVPCHRVVGADGSLTGYAGGVQRKQWLLDLERGA